MSGSSFSGNGAKNGGAIFNGGTLTVSGSAFSGNQATSSNMMLGGGGTGGAIFNDYTLTVTASTFSDNNASIGLGNPPNGWGAAISNWGTLIVAGSTFSGNGSEVQSSNGGAISNDLGQLIVSRSTFSANAAISGSAIYNQALLTMAADIFNDSCGTNQYGTWYDRGYNVASNNSCLKGGTTDVEDRSLTSLLGPLAANGGPTETILPLTGNPAIGLVPYPTSATIDGVSVRLCPTTDQRGVRSAPGEACNAGSVQFGPTAPPAITSATVTGFADGTMNSFEVTTAGSAFGRTSVMSRHRAL